MKNQNTEEIQNYISACLARKNFKGEDLADVSLQKIDFRGCIMDGICLENSDLTDSNMSGCNLYWGILFYANFTNCNFVDAKLNGVSVTGANFTSANLCGADFGNDYLGRPTQLSGANFTDAVYDNSTVFPDNFDPTSSGLIRENRPKTSQS
jgi:uncharacterized protein YjbI with pentapeptide repeats